MDNLIGRQFHQPQSRRFALKSAKICATKLMREIRNMVFLIRHHLPFSGDSTLRWFSRGEAEGSSSEESGEGVGKEKQGNVQK